MFSLSSVNFKTEHWSCFKKWLVAGDDDLYTICSSNPDDISIFYPFSARWVLILNFHLNDLALCIGLLRPDILGRFLYYFSYWCQGRRFLDILLASFLVLPVSGRLFHPSSDVCLTFLTGQIHATANEISFHRLQIYQICLGCRFIFLFSWSRLNNQS